jgi:hypothetical protein
LHRSLKRKLVIGSAALATAAFAGGAYAATQNSGPSTRQAFLNDVAARLHVTPQQLSSALNGAFTDQLQAAVRAGKLTQAQADALKQHLKQGSAPALPLPFFPPGAPKRFFGLGPFGEPGAVPAAASYLGLTTAQLAQQLSSGKSLAQIATAHGKSVNGLEQAMIAPIRTKLDKLVANKMLTSAQEQKILSRLSARVAAEVNQKGLPFRFMKPGMARPGMPAPQFRVPPGWPKGPVPPGVPVPPVPPAYVPAPPVAPSA